MNGWEAEISVLPLHCLFLVSMIKQVYGLLSEISPPSQKQRERMESSGSSSGSKRARAAGQQQQQQVVVSCLVDGCKSDLSKCRDYHRRHKVCEVHSKTGRVSIGGREQRFCQQCSRFHSLGEFDEGKRSCRKRLEGHNRRRRKPQQQPADPSAIKPSTFGGGYLAFGSGSHMMSSGNSPAAMFSSQSQQQRRFPFLQSVGATSSSSGGSQLGLDRALSLLSSSSPSLIASSALNYTTTINNSQSNCNCNISGGGGGVGIQGSQLLPPNSATIHHCQDVSFHAAAAAAAAASSSQSQQTLSFLWE